MARTSTSSSNPVLGIQELLGILRAEYGAPNWWPGDSRFEVAVGAILTQRAAWENAELAISNLRRRRKLSSESLARASISEIESLVRPSGFYKQKARYLKAFANHIVERYSGDMARMQESEPLGLRDELLGLPGIGPETADSILLYAINAPSFVVDAYTHRLLDRLGMNSSRDYLVLKTRFEEALGRDSTDLADMHALIVIHCKSHCLKTPKCEECCLASRCPSKREQQHQDIANDRRND